MQPKYLVLSEEEVSSSKLYSFRFKSTDLLWSAKVEFFELALALLSLFLTIHTFLWTQQFVGSPSLRWWDKHFEICAFLRGSCLRCCFSKPFLWLLSIQRLGIHPFWASKYPWRPCQTCWSSTLASTSFKIFSPLLPHCCTNMVRSLGN